MKGLTKEMLQLASARMMLGKLGLKFSDKHVLGIKWFAGLPIALEKSDISEYVFDEGNLLAARFWSAYMSSPDDTLKAVSKIRSELKKLVSGASFKPANAAMSALYNVDKHACSFKEASYIAADIAGMKPSSAPAMERAMRRLRDKAKAKRTKSTKNLSG